MKISKNEIENIVPRVFGGENLSNIIEEQEKSGQNWLVNSVKIPVNINLHEDSKDYLTKIGITDIENIPEDELFYNVKLPEGWKIESTDHSMWSDCIDNNEKIRFSIFYKAAFYDRNAHVSPKTRYSIYQKYENDDKNDITYITNQIKDGDIVIKEFEKYILKNNGIYDYKSSDTEYKKAEEWMIANYPDYKDIYAYWN